MAEKKRERLMILGAGVMQGPAIRLAGEMGLETVVVDADPNAPCADLADRFERIDLKDKEGIEALGRSLLENGGLAGIMTAGTDFSASVAWAANRLGLPGIPYEAALNASDKERMRRCFKSAGLPSPEFVILRQPGGEPLPFGYPVVVKPVDNMGARGCRLVEKPGGLDAAVTDALDCSRSGRVIVEEYMDGLEYSVDAIIYRGEITICGVADRFIYFPPFFIEMGHAIPANLSPEDQEDLLDVFIRGVRALGLMEASSVGAAKGDLKLTSQGPMIGEIAARLSGGYMSGWTFPYATGVEVTRGAILAALGASPGDLSPRRNEASAEQALISIPGKIRSIQGLKEAESMPCVKNIFMRVAEGDRVRFPKNNVTKCGNIIAAASAYNAALIALKKPAAGVLFRLEAPDTETERFLRSPIADIFLDISQDKKVLDALERLPAPEAECSEAWDPARTDYLGILHFPEFTEPDRVDYLGRSVWDNLEAVRALTGLPLPLLVVNGETPLRAPYFALGRVFWTAMLHGGYQGATYMVDCFLRGIRLNLKKA